MDIKRSIRNYKKGIRNSVVEQISVDFFIEKIEEAAKKFKYTPKYKNIREIIKELTNNGFSVIYYYNDLFRTGKYYIKECNLIIENMSIIYNGAEGYQSLSQNWNNISFIPFLKYIVNNKKEWNNELKNMLQNEKENIIEYLKEIFINDNNKFNNIRYFFNKFIETYIEISNPIKLEFQDIKDMENIGIIIEKNIKSNCGSNINEKNPHENEYLINKKNLQIAIGQLDTNFYKYTIDKNGNYIAIPIYYISLKSPLLSNLKMALDLTSFEITNEWLEELDEKLPIWIEETNIQRKSCQKAVKIKTLEKNTVSILVENKMKELNCEYTLSEDTKNFKLKIKIKAKRFIEIDLPRNNCKKIKEQLDEIQNAVEYINHIPAKVKIGIYEKDITWKKN